MITKKIGGFIEKNKKRIPYVKINEKIREKLKEALVSLNIGVEVERWIGFSIFSSLIISVLFLYYGIMYSLLSFIFLSSYFIALPFIEKSGKEKRIEGELPLFLKNLGTLLNIGLPYIDSLKMSSKDFKEINEEIAIVLKEVERGKSLSSSLKELYDKFGSLTIRRAIAQMINTYESGSKGKELKDLGQELINIQRHKIKDYSAKLNMISLLFIMVSVVSPTFIILLSIINPIVFSQESKNYDAMLLILFPTISVLLFTLSKALLPITSFKREKEDFYIIAGGYLIAGIIILDYDVLIKLGIISVMALVAGSRILKRISEERRKEEIEKEISNALLIMSTSPEGTKIEDIFDRIEKAKLGEIGKEFGKAKDMLKTGIREGVVFDELKRRMGSALISKVIDVLKYSLEVGVEVNKRMAEMAEDILNYLEVKREMVSSLSIQKYSLIMGVIIMAIVSGSSISVIKDMGKDIGGMWEIIMAYLLINSSIVSWFSSSLEEKKSNAYIYFAFLSLISSGVFYYITEGI